MSTTTKPTVLFWIVAVLALLWNIIGVFQLIASLFMKELMSEGMTAEELELINQLPAWYTIFFAVATIGGLLACITMLLRKKITVSLFLISLIAVLVAQGYWLVGTDALEIIGTEAIYMPLVVVVISIFLYIYSKAAQKKGWLH